MAGLATAFGSGAMTNSINELLETEVILLIGANTTEAHPVTGYRIKQVVKDGAKLIVVDPRKIELTRYADLWLRLKPGSNVALLNGLAHIILKEDLWDKEFVQERSEGFEEWVKGIEEYTPERVAEITGVDPELLVQAARMYASAQRATIVYAMGITQHTSGTDNVFALANLAVLTGNVGRSGTGVDPLRGQNNVQGACDMGALPDYYPSYQPVSEEANRRKFAEYWDAELPGERGLTVTEMFEAAYEGSIKCMYIIGENPMLSDPDGNHVRAAMENLEFLVVQDIFLTDTAKLAHVVLPAASFAEKEGTFTNTERRIQRVRKAVEPPGEAKADWEIIMALANRLGAPWQYRNPEEIMAEIARVAPHYGGITYPRLEEHGLQWPCPTEDHPGTQYLHRDKFARGKGKFHVVRYRNPAEEPDSQYPLNLITGRMLYHFHTGSMSRRSKGIGELHSHELAMMSPEDARAYGIKDGDTIEVESRRGKVRSTVQVTDHVPPGNIFMTFHFAETPTNLLTNSATDPVCKIPELKVCAVKVSKV